MTTMTDVTSFLSRLQVERDSFRNTVVKIRQLLGITDPATLTETRLQNILNEYNALKAANTTIPGAGGTLVTPTGFTGASVAVDPFWKKTFEDDFPNLAAEGAFLSTYSRWNAYPRWYLTTQGQKVVGKDPYGKDILQGDHYETTNLSVRDVDGLRVLNCQLRPRTTTPDNRNWCAAPYPRFDIGLGEARSRSMKLEMRVRIPNPKANWHIANLLWFDDEPWPYGGEVDFWEQDPLGTIGGFFHYHGATHGGDQMEIRSAVKPTDWHVIGFEFISGKSYKQFLDGKQYGPTITSRIPTSPARLVLQNEVDGSPTEPMDVQYDWVRCYTPA